jgi:DNA-binding beta-propeller fold protein YncE
MKGFTAVVWLGVGLVLGGSERVQRVVGTGEQGFGGDGGPAIEARLDQPFDVAFDPGGNLVLSDTFNHRIRRVDARTGVITTIAGDGTKGFGGDGGRAVEARLDEPYGVAVDGAGHVYFADRLNRRVRRIDAGTGVITTVAGDGSERDGRDGGLAVETGLVEPNGVALDGRGRLYIADVGACRVRVVDLEDGTIRTIAGTGRRRHSGDGGPAAEADVHGARAVEVAPNGDLYVVEREGNRVRRIDAATGIITTVAGTGEAGYAGDGGPPEAGRLRGPKEIAVAADGTVLVVDTENHAIRRIDGGARTITSVVGDGVAGAGELDGPASRARLDRPHGVAVGPDGSIWVADTNNHRVVRVGR